MNFCLPCREFVQHHRKAVRWAALLMILSIIFTLLGLVSESVVCAGFCRVYP